MYRKIERESKWTAWYKCSKYQSTGCNIRLYAVVEHANNNNSLDIMTVHTYTHTVRVYTTNRTLISIVVENRNKNYPVYHNVISRKYFYISCTLSF